MRGAADGEEEQCVFLEKRPARSALLYKWRELPTLAFWGYRPTHCAKEANAF